MGLRQDIKKKKIKQKKNHTPRGGKPSRGNSATTSTRPEEID